MKDIPIRKIKSPEIEPVFSENFSIREVQGLLSGKDQSQDLHRHDFFFILALKKGSGRHEIDFTSYKVSDHTLFFMRPGQVHQHTLKAGSTGFLIEFKPEFYSPHDKQSGQLLRKASKINFYQMEASRFNKIHPVLSHIFKEYAGKQEGYREVIKANLDILFIELIRLGKYSHPDNITPYHQEQLEKFLALIETHIALQKQVSQYADMLNLSVYQLNAITKATLGKTGSELINEYIILEARRYLLATSSLVSQIAYHLGYEDVSYFIRFFKKHTGYSPDAFRQNFK